MSTIQQLDQLVDIAQQLGFRVRYDYFGGTGGGICQFAGQKWIFIDLALTSVEQLVQLQQALNDDPFWSALGPQNVLSDQPVGRAA